MRQDGHRCLLGVFPLILTLLFVFIGVALSDESFTLSDAGVHDAFNMGDAQGQTTIVHDTELDRDVLSVDVTMSPGGKVGVYTKEYPVELTRDQVDRISFGVKLSGDGLIDNVSVGAEVKGASGGISHVPLESTSNGWKQTVHDIDWNAIGDLTEVVFVVSSNDANNTIQGTVLIDCLFDKKSIEASPEISESIDPDPVSSEESEPTAGSWRLLDSGMQGALNIGESQAAMNSVEDPDSDSGEEIVRLEFTIPPGSAAGIWTKEYPAELTSETADVVYFNLRTEDGNAVEGYNVKAEIKGSNGVQNVPLTFEGDRCDLRARLEWGQIGELDEVVFVIEPSGVDETVEGVLFLDCRFEKISAKEQFQASIQGRFLAVLAAALAAALLFGLIRIALAAALKNDESENSTAISTQKNKNVLREFPSDLAFGMAATLLLVVVFTIQHLGSVDPLDVGLFPILAALLGVLVGGLFKLGAKGGLLRTGEAFQHALVTGLFVASASTQTVWQAPSGLTDFFTLSATGAATFCVIYHGANAYSLSNRKKSLGAIGALIAVGIPYAFGLLLSLQSGELNSTLGAIASLQIFADESIFPRLIGQTLLVFLFSELLVNAFSLTSRRRLLKDWKAHLFLLLFATGVILAPKIADFGSGAVLLPGGRAIPVALHPLAALFGTILSQGLLWAIVFMLTGVILDGMRSNAPTASSIRTHGIGGFRKGAVFSGILMGLLLILHGLVNASIIQTAFTTAPWLVLAASGAIVFPLGKTIVESFDGSQSFFERAVRAYRSPVLYGRGVIIGLGAAIALNLDFFTLSTAERIGFGCLVGATAYAGVSLIRDRILIAQGRGAVRPPKAYLIESLLGGFVGAGLGFYLDAAQTPVVLEKFRLYNSFAMTPTHDEFYPLISKWGLIQLESYTGGAKLLFNEALKGVIGWGTAAWLFALNRSFLTALFRREMGPIRRIFTREGAAELTDGTIHVLRWGLWMAPIIFTFLRQMSTPTWYNQDGAVHTVFCIFNGFSMNGEQFNAWSLKVFIWVLAYDLFRIVIWIDHMGLRVATLVNLSFLGMDRLDDQAGRLIGPTAGSRVIPEGIKRFMTWAPLLIPFYIPAGADWDRAWSTSESIQNASQGMLPTLLALPSTRIACLFLGTVGTVAGLSCILRALRRRKAIHVAQEYQIANGQYVVSAKTNGELNSRLPVEGFDVTRRSYEGVEPAGRAFFLSEQTDVGRTIRPIAGNYPEELFALSKLTREGDVLRLTNESDGIRTEIEISIPDADAAAEVWDVRLENLTSRTRTLQVSPYLEWVLNLPGADRGHTQYNRLFPEMSYEPKQNAVLALHRYTKKVGFLAIDQTPQGFLTSRVDFIGRAGTIWNPRALETLDFLPPENTEPYPTFDPIGSLLVDVSLESRGTASVRFLIGAADDREEAREWIERLLGTGSESSTKIEPKATSAQELRRPLIGHGEILPNTPKPYYEFEEQGRRLRVKTPFTPRPYDHLMSNALGHVLCVTNRGLHSSASFNAQQNRLTTDWADVTTTELPAEAIYLYDEEEQRWLSPAYFPLRDEEAKYDVAFGVDGTATFRMERNDAATELTVFVPPNDPTGVYLLTVSNRSKKTKRFRLSPYFQIALADNPENAGPLSIRRDAEKNAVYFNNPRNTFRTGPAFAAVSFEADAIETRRGRFFGEGRSFAHPQFVDGASDSSQNVQDASDAQPVAAFVTTLEIPPGESKTVSIVLGQADNRKQAEAVVAKYGNVEAAQSALVETRTWWNGFMNTLSVETNDSEFDGYLNWLKYQALAERIWARKGFYQASGAFGFRDQLQDSVNMIWVDPTLARRQILLHASQQFLEGDTVHWFFRLQDGRTGFACRSHAYDNLLWLGWATVEYVRMTGDASILNEKVSYLLAETPLPPLPQGKHGMGFHPHRAPLEESLLDHVLRAIDLVLNRRIGEHGLPLIGAGDWNDGLDEIGSEGRGESAWLGFFLYYILNNLSPHLGSEKGAETQALYAARVDSLHESLENVWRGDRYLRAIHDDGTEIGIEGSGIWEIDALTAAWAVMSGVNPERGRTIFDTALRELERENVILLGNPALREDTKPYLGRSCRYPEGVRENGMYCHGVQWLIRAARLLSEQLAEQGDSETAAYYRDATIRLWRKISPLSHMDEQEIEIYGGQPNKQAADMLTTFDQGRMIWNGYTGAAGWMLRQACEGVLGVVLNDNEIQQPEDLDVPRGDLKVNGIRRDLSKSPLRKPVK